MRIFCLMALMLTMLGGCALRPGERLCRHDDEIMVAGQRFRIGTPVVLWTDPGGYDAYRVERRFSPRDEDSWNEAQDELVTPNRYGLRYARAWDDADFDRLRGGGWDLDLLRACIDQFVIHYDATGTSRTCFRVLHDQRDLSVHFLLDLDGTIYQTLDLKERAWHAGPANDRSIGIEIANIGAYPFANAGALGEWYETAPDGTSRVTLPGSVEPSGIRTPNFFPRPARELPIVGTINGGELVQYDFTPEQYDALAKLAAALSNIFPNLELTAPRDDAGRVVNHVLTEAQRAEFHGVLGHYHISPDKQDPGPAFQWDRVLNEAKRLR